MPRFITTIELHDADKADYERLNNELERKSFRSNMSFGKQTEIAVQKREYNREGNITIQEVTDAVVRAAAKTGKRYSFTIIRNKPVYN